jgi:ribA/ribD-fused uncharacterized protein
MKPSSSRDDGPIDSFKGPYAFLSNFHPAPVSLDEDVYPTVEHAYQAAKTLSPDERTKVRNASTPGQAKRMGRKVTFRSDFDLIKIDVMYNLLKAKFAWYDLQSFLMDTGSRELIEGNEWGDTFWGVDRRTGTGRNHLGKLLMRVRSEIREGKR